MSVKINDSTKIHGKFVVVEENQIDPTVISIYAMFYPVGRYPNGIGGQNHRILSYGAMVNGKPAYGYGDEVVSWSGTRWEMNNVYSGTISYSNQNVDYPWLVTNWYYGANVLDTSVYVNVQS
jgi:hypothetical protein